MAERCKETVWDGSTWRHRKCLHDATRDGYCGQHHPDAVKRRRGKAEARYQKESAVRAAKQKREDFDRRAGARCRELGIQPEDIR